MSVLLSAAALNVLKPLKWTSLNKPRFCLQSLHCCLSESFIVAVIMHKKQYDRL